ncbi:hypothetical protein [Geoalkalibacter halelectricus]|uniref:Cysteine-rich CWC n=1 Tax=Geoalkalibacter halelectricus TaxID=2847045 RepID=A0ABY5ZNF2_9BACT|nr:hypothetical protein [Geoalkalibacter halelectricus]MDO3379842.1 hypothetical protein [Geoalkalibacter halelectricus]UWZ80626.1 hypothetical protein L9S41_04310 [Geoalkalibacter halelectricus]
MKGLFECSKCGVVAEISEQLCEPLERTDKQQYCGSAPERGTLCESMRERLPFVCGACGRPAKQAEAVCEPLVTAWPQ